MSDRNTVEVVIDGKIYELSGAESEGYLQQVASYLNGKIAILKRDARGYGKLEDSVRSLLLEINISDDYFRQLEEIRQTRKDLEEKEREAYSAKHDLINMEMKLEAALHQLEETQVKLQAAEKKLALMEARAGAAEGKSSGGHR